MKGPSFREYQKSDFEQLWEKYKKGEFGLGQNWSKMEFLSWMYSAKAKFQRIYLGFYDNKLIAFIGCYVDDDQISPHVDYFANVSTIQIYKLTRFFLNSVAVEFPKVSLSIVKKFRNLFDHLMIYCNIEYKGESDNECQYSITRNDDGCAK